MLLIAWAPSLAADRLGRGSWKSRPRKLRRLRARGFDTTGRGVSARRVRLATGAVDAVGSMLRRRSHLSVRATVSLAKWGRNDECGDARPGGAEGQGWRPEGWEDCAVCQAFDNHE
jgi:hypothetical protein